MSRKKISCRMRQSHIARSIGALVPFWTDGNNAFMPCSNAADYVPCLVRAAVIDHDQFEIWPSLRQYALHRRADNAGCVVCRHDDADLGGILNLDKPRGWRGQIVNRK